MRKLEFKKRHAAAVQDVAGRSNLVVTTRDVRKGVRVETRSVVSVDDTELVLLRMALDGVKPIGGWPNLDTSQDKGL